MRTILVMGLLVGLTGCGGSDEPPSRDQQKSGRPEFKDLELAEFALVCVAEHRRLASLYLEKLKLCKSSGDDACAQESAKLMRVELSQARSWLEISRYYREKAERKLK